MPTLAAVDLGAQSGRVAVGQLRRRATRRHRGAPVRQRPVRTGERAPVGRACASTATCSTGSARPPREAGQVDSVAVDSWGVDFGLIDRNGRLLANPVHYRDARRAHAPWTTCSSGCPPRELYERTGIQLMPINTVFELARDGRRGRRRRSTAADDAAAHPRPPPLLALRRAHHRVHERDDDASASTRGRGSLGDRPARAARRSPTAAARGRRARHQARAARAGRRGETGLGAAGRRGRDARHRLGGRGGPVPASRRRSFISAGTWSLVGLEVDASP